MELLSPAWERTDNAQLPLWHHRSDLGTSRRRLLGRFPCGYPYDGFMDTSVELVTFGIGFFW